MSKNSKPKTQPVEFFRPRTFWRPVAIINEKGTMTRELEAVAIYDAAGIICWLDSCELGDAIQRSGKRSFAINLPIIWKTFTAPDFTEARAHIVARDSFGERKYTLFIPVKAVTLDPCAGYSVSKSAGHVRRFFTVEGFPRKFDTWSFHPFDRYAMLHELEELQKEQYHVLTGDDIVKPYARERIAQFIAKLEEYTAEAERIQAISEDEYISECGALNPRFTWHDGCFTQVKED